MRMRKEPSVYREVTKTSEVFRALKWHGKHYLIGDVAYEQPRYCKYLGDVMDLIKYYDLFVKWYSRKYTAKFAAITIPYSVFIEQLDLIQQVKKECGVQHVVGQGLSAFLYLRKRGIVDQTMTLILDGGFNTNNLVITESDSPVFTRTYYNILGIRDLIEKYFEPLVRKKIPDVSSNLLRLDEALRKGFIDMGHKRVSLMKEKKIATSQYLDDLYEIVNKDLSREAIDYQQILIIGGLVHFIDKDLFETEKKLIVPTTNPEFANVAGAYMLAEKNYAIDVGFGYTKMCGPDKSF